MANKSVEVILGAVKSAGEAALRLHEENDRLREWIASASCKDDCSTWEPDTIDGTHAINSGPCNCGRLDIINERAAVQQSGAQE